MAGQRRLKRLLLALAAAVLAAHLLALDWIHLHLQLGSELRPMPKPLFTRLLRPAHPPPVVQAPPPAPKPRRVAAPAAAAASQPEQAPQPAEAPPQPQAEGEPQPPAQSAAPPEPVASAPAAEPAPPADPLASWPTDTRLSYRLGGKFRSGELHGDARVQWQREGNAYQVRVEVDLSPFGGRTFTSQGEVTPAGLQPRAYEELMRPSGKRRGAQLGATAIALEGGRSVPRPDGVQDTASQFVELAHRFATGQAALEVGRTVSFWMARPGAVDYWTYDVVAREPLQTEGLGVVEAFHLKPRPIANPRGNVTAEMWFAPSLQYLPVRVRININEGFLDLMVEKIEQK